MNVKKYSIKIFQAIAIAFCCFLSALVSALFSGNSWVVFLQMTIFSVLFLRLKPQQHFKIWHVLIWFALFPCYYIGVGQSEYGGSWHSRISDMYTLEVSNLLPSLVTLFFGPGAGHLRIEQFSEEHNSLILYQVYSFLFFFFSTFLFFVKKDRRKIPTVIFTGKTFFIGLFLLSVSLGYHFFSSETDRSFRYENNIPLWNSSLCYLLVYFTFFSLFFSFKNRIFNFNTSVSMILVTLLIACFPVISVSPVMIESYFIDDGKFRAARQVVFSPLFHALTTTVVTTFEDLTVRFAYIHIYSVRMYTVFQAVWALVFILPLLTPEINKTADQNKGSHSA